MAAGYARVGVPGCHLNGRRQRHCCVRPQRNSGVIVAKKRDDRHIAINLHCAGSVHHRLRAVPGHCGDHRRQRACLHRCVLGPQAQAPLQLFACVASRVRPVRSPTRHAHGPALPGSGEMAVRPIHVRSLGAYIQYVKHDNIITNII